MCLLGDFNMSTELVRRRLEECSGQAWRRASSLLPAPQYRLGSLHAQPAQGCIDDIFMPVQQSWQFLAAEWICDRSDPQTDVLPSDHRGLMATIGFSEDRVD